MHLPLWLMKLGFRRAHLINDNYKEHKEYQEVGCHPADANIITSRTFDDMHVIQLDLDIEHYYVPSTTPGHGHLFINKELSWAKYANLLNVLADLEIIQNGYRDCSLKRGYSALRVPGLDKNDPKHNKGVKKNAKS